MIFSIQHLYYLVGAILAITACMTLADKGHSKRYSSALFWGLYALVFLIGEKLAPEWVGVGVIVMALIAGFGGVGFGKHKPRTDSEYMASAKRLGNKLFMPALAIPVVTVIGTLWLHNIKIGDVPLLDPKNTTLMRLGLG